ncbi:4'-phosphopantetheinyl transferase superfamily protein [Streptomyces kunmingensis]|uniref:4'-phosphopantetheinyl transferase superfamily protein n=1 Tax=Streptomyces kunmingensis TaxID=68225 RepID=A0ABU6CC31_9ACTN|nr:4'-phosphopantetheinyl transferase superfamily protein [Streptomyces kunmingensis]MEB3962172.1 4'-phosphopantetheinyl transferase superfamily protein [Streptomyces kunmingensis]
MSAWDARESATAGAAPVYVASPDGPWDLVQDRFATAGRVVVHTTWGAWAPAALLDPQLRQVLGQDWPRYRQAPRAGQRLGFAASRHVMKYTVAAVLEIPVQTIDFTFRPGGRPGVRGWDELALSLAHTDELLVVGVSRTGPVGVDAERADRSIPFDLMGEEVCTPAEAARLAALPEEGRRAGLLRLWTLKEAYTKALGYGLRHSFSRVGFEEDADGRTRLAAPAPDIDAWTFDTHRVLDRYLVSEAHRGALPGPSAASPSAAGAAGATAPGDEGPRDRA